MSPLILVIIGIVIGAVLVYRPIRERVKIQIQKILPKQSAEKEERKEKIMAVLMERGTITNDEVEKLVGVANTSAYRYLEELEKEGKIEQIGGTGRNVHYRLKS